MTQALLIEENVGDVEKVASRAARMRVLFARNSERHGHSPVLFTNNRPGGNDREALWKYPDAALIEWDLRSGSETGGEIDAKMASIKQSLGTQPFRLIAVKMVLDVESSDFREAFFQCLCNSRWAHRGELVVAARIDDEFIAETLLSLGREYGIGVSSLGLSLDQMDEWEEASRICDMKGPELEAILKAIEPQRICEGRTQPHMDWEALRPLQEENENFQKLFDWIADCLSAGKPVPFEENAELG